VEMDGFMPKNASLRNSSIDVFSLAVLCAKSADVPIFTVPYTLHCSTKLGFSKW